MRNSVALREQQDTIMITRLLSPNVNALVSTVVRGSRSIIAVLSLPSTADSAALTNSIPVKKPAVVRCGPLQPDRESRR